MLEDNLPAILIFSSRLPSQNYVNTDTECKVEIRHINLNMAATVDLEMSPKDAGRYKEIRFDWSIDYLDLDLLYPHEEWADLSLRLAYLVEYLKPFLSSDGSITICATSYQDSAHYDEDAEEVMLGYWIRGLNIVGYEATSATPEKLSFDGLILHYTTADKWDGFISAPENSLQMLYPCEV